MAAHDAPPQRPAPRPSPDPAPEGGLGLEGDASQDVAPPPEGGEAGGQPEGRPRPTEAAKKNLSKIRKDLREAAATWHHVRGLPTDELSAWGQTRVPGANWADLGDSTDGEASPSRGSWYTLSFQERQDLVLKTAWLRLLNAAFRMASARWAFVRRYDLTGMDYPQLPALGELGAGLLPDPPCWESLADHLEEAFWDSVLVAVPGQATAQQLVASPVAGHPEGIPADQAGTSCRWFRLPEGVYPTVGAPQGSDWANRVDPEADRRRLQALLDAVVVRRGPFLQWLTPEGSAAAREGERRAQEEEDHAAAQTVAAAQAEESDI